MKFDENSKRLDRILTGPVGIVYLMFMGRDTYVAMIKDHLVNSGIYKKAPSVDQAAKRLLKHGTEFLVFRREYRKKRKGGRKARIYTASFEPVFRTLKAFGIDFDKKQFQDASRYLSMANDSFPQYLVNTFETSFLHNSPWHSTLASYFHFMSELLLRTSLDPKIVSRIEQAYAVFPLDISISKEKVDLLLNKHPDLAKKFRSTALRMSLPKVGLNSALYQMLVENLPNIDENFIKMTSAYSELVDFLKLLRSYDVKSVMDYIERIRETEEFVKWKLEREKKKKD